MTDITSPELTLTRVFNAPREQVWKAWTDPAMLAKWWGPQGFTNPVCEIDPQPGGKINIVMEDSEGMIAKGSQYPMEGTYQEVIEPEKIVFSSSAVRNGTAMFDTLTTVTFEETSGATTLKLHTIVTKIYDEEAAKAPLAGMEQGWSQSLDKLAESLK